jgi:pseudouridine-5'-phosphate glycosidase
VVSAGAKAILDLPRTLEMLETLGVLVVGYRTSEFPAFYSPRSGLVLEHRVEDAEQLAEVTRQHWSILGVASAVLVCNPIPAEAAIDVDDAIARALEDAKLAGVTGKRITPFLLSRLADATDGKSIRANRALALNNARVAAELAVAMASTYRA